jgi:hypothetical protein
MAHLQPNVFLRQDGTPPHWASRWESLNKTDWAGWHPRFPDITPLDFLSLGLCKGPSIPSKSWCGWTSCTNQQCSCFCDTPYAGKHIMWNRVPVWTFCELQMALTCRRIELDELFFQVKHSSSLHLVYSLCFVCIWNVGKLGPPCVSISKVWTYVPENCRKLCYNLRKCVKICSFWDRTEYEGESVNRSQIKLKLL